MVDQPSRVGQLLGNYHLIRLLGKGGFAEVYLGKHIRLGTQAAIKVLHAQLAAQDIEQFHQEARIIAHLEHPNIVRVLDFGVDGSAPFLVMSYAPNGTLRDRHPRGKTLPLPVVVSYTKQIANALQYAHSERLVHRDIKPGNMLLDRHYNVLLSDFGFALVTHSSRSQITQEVVGTVAYMSPEQIQGKSRPASDQYSLGIVVYEWLCGDRPFRGSLPELCARHMFAPPPPLRERVPNIPPLLEEVVMTALAKDPKQRFASIMEFAIALERASHVRQEQTFISSPAVNTPYPFVPTYPLSVSSKQFSQRVDVVSSPPGMVLQAARRTNYLSRRVVMTSLVGLTILAGGAIWLATSHASKAVLPNLPPKRSKNTIFIYKGHSSFVVAVAWSPDGKRIASSSWDATVQVWDATNGDDPLIYRGHGLFVYAVAWAPDGKHIASCSVDKIVQVWDAVNGDTAFTYEGHTDFVDAVAWSPDEQRIASGSWDTTVQVWDAMDGNNAFIYTGHHNFVNTVAWSPDGNSIASGDNDNTVQVWNAADGTPIVTYRGHTGPVSTVAWSPDGRYIASGSGDNTVHIWDALSGDKILVYPKHSSFVNTVAWSPDGKRIASGSNDNTVQVWDATNGSTILTYSDHTSGVFGVSWSPDGKYIASGSDDTTVRVWAV